MPIYYDRSRQRWRYEFDRYLGGQRQRTTKLLPKGWSRAQADAFANEHDPRLFALATGTVKPRPLISQAVHLYLTEHAPDLKNFRSLEREMVNCLPAYEGRHMDELADVAREYASEQRKTLKPATIKNRLAYLRAACRWAWKHHNLGEHDPAEKMMMPKVKNERHRYLDRLQLLQVARQIKNLDARAVVLVLFYSGMRLGEALRAKPTARGWLLEDTKNGERRLIPIHPKTAHLARAWPRDVPVRTVQGCFARGVAACGLEDVRVHDLRHSAASAMINAGVDLYTVGGVLGHKAAASTKRYSHLANQTMVDAVNSIGRRR